MNRIQSKQATPIIHVEVGNLFTLRQQIKDMQEHERAITKRILGFLESSKLSQLECDGIKATMSVCEKLSIDSRKFHERVNEESFFNAVTVSVPKAREVLAEEMLRRISSITSYNQLRLAEV